MKSDPKRLSKMWSATTARSRLLVGFVAIALMLGWSMPRPVAAQTAANAPPQHYYLALGDSLAFGYQDAKVHAEAPNVNPTTFNTGYVDDFAAMLAIVRPDIQTVNYACPGATTAEFVSTPGCPSYPFPLHAGYSGSQLDAAVAFLQAHPGQVNPITVSLGNDDVLRLAQSCGGFTASSVACVVPKLPALLQSVGANLTRILATLRSAAPNSEIIVTQSYDPAAIDPTIAAAADTVILALNHVIASAATSQGALVADFFAPFNRTPDGPQALCRLTLICTPDRDIHPSDAGYAVAAQQVWNASGYAKLASLFVVGFDSTQPGQGLVYFGSGPGCSGLVQVATRDIHPGTNAHAVIVTGNDLPGSVGDIGISPGTTYWYQTVTATKAGEQIDNNFGKCYSETMPGP